MFTNEDVIHAYTRKEAIADGTLIPLDPDLLREAGVKHPACITVGLYAELNPTAAEAAVGQDLDGRLSDILMLFRTKAKRTNNCHLSFRMIVLREYGQDEVDVVAICGPGDGAAPVITLMLPSEA